MEIARLFSSSVTPELSDRTPDSPRRVTRFERRRRRVGDRTATRRDRPLGDCRRNSHAWTGNPADERSASRRTRRRRSRRTSPVAPRSGWPSLACRSRRPRESDTARSGPRVTLPGDHTRPVGESIDDESRALTMRDGPSRSRWTETSVTCRPVRRSRDVACVTVRGYVAS